MAAEPLQRVTKPTKRVLEVLMEAPTEELYGLDMGQRAQLKSGSLYPILARLEQRGWLESRWEDSPDAGRPRRRYYRLTGGGIDLARKALSDAADVGSGAGFVPGQAAGGAS